MKTSIDQHGTLTVAAESPLEAYAIQAWLKENPNLPKGLLVVGAWPPYPTGGIVPRVGEDVIVRDALARDVVSRGLPPFEVRYADRKPMPSPELER